MCLSHNMILLIDEWKSTNVSLGPIRVCFQKAIIGYYRKKLLAVTFRYRWHTANLCKIGAMCYRKLNLRCVSCMIPL